MVYAVFYKTSSFAGYCFPDKNSIHPKRCGVFSFKAFIAVLVKIQICSFIVEGRGRPAHWNPQKSCAVKAFSFLVICHKAVYNKGREGL